VGQNRALAFADKQKIMEDFFAPNNIRGQNTGLTRRVNRIV